MGKDHKGLTCKCGFEFAGPGEYRNCEAFILGGRSGVVCPDCGQCYVRNEPVKLEGDNEPPQRETRLFRNYYNCSSCGEDWTDEWSCRCNDKCPSCNAEIEPYRSEDITDE